MKILLAVDTFLPTVDGALTAIMTLAEGFCKSGHEISFLVPRQPRLASPNGFRVFPMRAVSFITFKPYRMALPWIKPVREQLQECDFDIVHVHSPFGAGIVARNIAWERRIPCVYSFHTLFTHSLHYYLKPFGGALATSLTRFVRQFCETVDGVVTTTEPVKQILINQYGVQNTIEVIHSGVDPQRVTKFSFQDVRQKYGIPKEVPIGLFVGRISHEKNFPWLFAALMEARRRNIPFHCLIVGAGPFQKHLIKMIHRFQLETVVTLTGFITEEERNACYAASDLFCMPSLVECQCMAAVEAMMNGVPVVGVRAVGLQETVADGVSGVLAEPEEADFVEKFCQLLSNPEQRKRLGEGAKRLSMKMSGEISAKAHLVLYQQQIASGTRQTSFLKPWSLIRTSLFPPKNKGYHAASKSI